MTMSQTALQSNGSYVVASRQTQSPALVYEFEDKIFGVRSEWAVYSIATIATRTATTSIKKQKRKKNIILDDFAILLVY